MTYDQFVQAVRELTEAKAAGAIDVNLHTAQKYNGVNRKGILFSGRESNISPVIYLEEYYHRFEEGESLDAIAGEILALYCKMRFCKPWEEQNIEDYEMVRKRIVYRLVNREANRKLLRNMPYVPYLNLAVIFYVLLEAEPYGTASMPVRTEHLNMWRVTEEELYKEAERNTRELLPFSFQDMRSVLAELTGIGETKKDTGDFMYVLSNRIFSFGAAVILYPGCLEEIGGRLGEDYYVLPSSVHEVIVIPKSEACGKTLLGMMVSEINNTQLMPEEILSDRAYYYDRACRELNM